MGNISLQILSWVLLLLQVELLSERTRAGIYLFIFNTKTEMIIRKYMQKPQSHFAFFCPPDTCFLSNVACGTQKTQRTAAGGFANALNMGKKIYANCAENCLWCTVAEKQCSPSLPVCLHNRSRKDARQLPAVHGKGIQQWNIICLHFHSLGEKNQQSASALAAWHSFWLTAFLEGGEGFRGEVNHSVCPAGQGKHEVQEWPPVHPNLLNDFA